MWSSVRFNSLSLQQQTYTHKDMKKLYILLIILTIASFDLFAQSLQLLTPSGQIIANGGTICLKWTLYDTTWDVNTELQIKNISSESADVKVIKTLKTLPGTQSAYFCFAGFCFGDTVTVSPNKLTLDAGKTDANFSAHINPFNFSGSAVVCYKFYTTKNPKDTVSVFVQSEVWHLGINDLSNFKVELGTAYPSPANDKFTVDYTLSGQQPARLVLQNVLGTSVREEPVSEGNGKIQVNVGGLAEGIYLYSLYVGDKIVSTKKLVIRH